MIELLTGSAFDDVLASATSARRLETRSAYFLGPEEQDQWPRFTAGDLAPSPLFSQWWEPWRERVAAATARGGGFDRVRIVAEPPTPYQRFALWCAHFNVASGERVHYATRADALGAELPDADFWVLDGKILLLLHYGFDDTLLGATVISDPAVVAVHDQWIDVAISAARSHQQFLAEDPDRGRPDSQ